MNSDGILDGNGQRRVRRADELGVELFGVLVCYAVRRVDIGELKYGRN